MTVWARILLTVGLDLALLVGATLIIQHSVAGAIKVLKVALKSEFTTDVGRLNLAGMVLFLFLMIFTNIHQTVIDAMSVEKPAPAANNVLAPVVLFGLGFVGSLVCVLVVEKKDE